MFPWLFNVYMVGVMKEVKTGMGRRRVRFLEDEREWRLTGHLYAEDLVVCSESEEGLRAMVGQFVEEDDEECEVHVDGIRLEHV